MIRSFVAIACPMIAVALFFGSVYVLLLRVFRGSIEAYSELSAFTATGEWGGPETLFTGVSVLLGLLNVWVLERRLGTGFTLLRISIPFCIATIGTSFAVARIIFGPPVAGMLDMLVYSLVSAIGACVIRVYWQSLR